MLTRKRVNIFATTAVNAKFKIYAVVTGSRSNVQIAHKDWRFAKKKQFYFVFRILVRTILEKVIQNTLCSNTLEKIYSEYVFELHKK